MNAWRLGKIGMGQFQVTWSNCFQLEHDLFDSTDSEAA